MAKNYKQFNLLEVADISGVRVSKYKGTKKYIATADIGLNQIISGTEVTYEDRPSRADLIMKQDEVLFAKMKSTKKVLSGSREVEDLIFSTGFYILKPKENVSKKYLYFFLLSDYFNTQKDAFCSGATMAAIGNVGLKKIHISIPVNSKGVPDFNEQERVASLLEETEKIQNKRTVADQKMEEVIPALFNEMFGDPDINEKCWKRELLSNVCKTIYRYPTFYGFNYQSDGIAVVKIGNILQNGLVDSNMLNYEYISSEVNERFPKTILELHDIVMAVRGDGSTGKRIGMITSQDLVGSNMSPNLLRFSANQEVINPIYLFYLMTSVGGQMLIGRKITRTAKKTITASDISLISIPIPPIELQNKFAEKTKKILELQFTQKESAVKIDNLFTSLLAKHTNN